MSESIPTEIHLKVITPTQTAVDESVKEVRLPGLDGELCILPGHCELVCALGHGDIVYIPAGSGREESLPIGGGNAEIYSDHILIFADAPQETNSETGTDTKTLQ
ncbi:MAG: F0F1 ATP synthase subunit epsilon [Acidobacteria bacterium]|nr:F0F1 ATP synthase subunit epsilon [Acidobacteriota bacterium]MBU4493818.1 F0F1 ATP synthase subunit epsilon [Acidobacteriota bacterium]